MKSINLISKFQTQWMVVEVGGSEFRGNASAKVLLNSYVTNGRSCVFGIEIKRERYERMSIFVKESSYRAYEYVECYVQVAMKYVP